MSVGITRDEYNAIIGEYEATIKDLRTRLEEAERERDKWKQKFKAGCQDDAEQCPVIDENAALKQKLEMVREWKKDYFGSLLGDAEDLNKILHGGESD